MSRYLSPCMECGKDIATDKAGPIMCHRCWQRAHNKPSPMQTWTIRPHESKSIIDGKPFVSWFEVTDGQREFIAFELPDAEWLQNTLESSDHQQQLTDVSL